jgi:hypothetical protein
MVVDFTSGDPIEDEEGPPPFPGLDKLREDAFDDPFSSLRPIGSNAKEDPIPPEWTPYDPQVSTTAKSQIIEAEVPPWLIDSVATNAMMAQMIQLVDEDPAFRQVLEALGAEAIGAHLAMPELLSSFLGSYQAAPEMWREVQRIRDDEGLGLEEALNNAFFTHGPIENVVEAIFAQTNSFDQAPWEEVLKGQNASLLLTEFGNEFNPAELDIITGLLSAMRLVQDAPESRIENPLKGEGATRGIAGPFNAIIGIAQLGQRVPDYDDIPEELAGEAVVWLREHPLNNEDDKRKFVTWFFMTGQQKIKEQQAEQGIVGAAGEFLDLPKHMVTNTLLKDMFVQFRAPDDGLDYSAMTLGQNIAMDLGLNPGDAEGSSFLNAPVVGHVADALKLSMNTIPAVGVASLARIAATDEGAFTTPLVGGMLDGLRSSNSYEFVSGGSDLLTWFFADPVNYLAAWGVGLKMTTNVARAKNLSKGRAFMQQIRPFMGAKSQATVRGGFNTKLAWSFFSRTTEEMAKQAPKSQAGRKLYATIRGSDGVEDVLVKVPVLDHAQAQILYNASHMDDTGEAFWATLRVQLTGVLDDGFGGGKHVAADVLAAHEQAIHSRAQVLLDKGDLVIGDVAHGVFGIQPRRLYAPITAPGNEAVVESLARGTDVALAAPEVGKATLRGGSEMSIHRVSDGTVYGLVDGEFAGAIRGADGKFLERVVDGETVRVAKDPEVGTAFDFRRQGVYTELQKHISAEGVEQIRTSPSRTAALEAAMGGGNHVHKAGTATLDGTKKIAVATRPGWAELDISGKDVNHLITYLTETDNVDLAAKLAIMGDGTLGALSPQETQVLMDWMTNHTGLHAMTLGDEVLFAPRAERRTLTGIDKAGGRTLSNVMSKELYDAAGAHSMRKLLDGGGGEIVLINRMPTVKQTVLARQKIADWTHLSGKSRGAQFFNKLSANLRHPIPHAVSFKNQHEGGQELRKFMEMLGGSRETRRDIMNQWWDTTTIEDRRTVFIHGMEQIGEEIGDPFLRYGLHQYWNRHGEHIFYRGVDGKEIGMGIASSGGRPRPHPPIKALMTDEAVLPNALDIQRTLRRYRMGSKHPRLTAGFGGTKKNREHLTDAYKHHIRQNFGDEIADGIHPDDLMSMAYADVIGFEGRTSGLGLANKIFQVPAKGYNMFHTTFVYAQLALRPFAWATRVNLEEHARGWMVGLPTLFANPTAYLAHAWDAKFWKNRTRAYSRQVVDAQNAADKIFRADTHVDDAIKQGEEILPGFKAELKKSGATTPEQARAVFLRELTDRLKFGMDVVNLGSSQNISRRAISRAAGLRVHNQRLFDLYHIGPTADLLDDVPEILNKLNVWHFSNEISSSVQKLDFTPSTRAQDVPAYGGAWLTKSAQMTNDQGIKYALRRMLEQMGGGTVTMTGDRFARTAYWADVRENVQAIARFNNQAFLDEAHMADWYLDTILRDDMINAHFGAFWGANPNERRRIVQDLLKGELNVNVAGEAFNLNLHRQAYANGREQAGRLFDNLYRSGEFRFPEIGGVFNPMAGNYGGKNPFKKAANAIMQTFGENVSQTLHRRPSYMAERRRWQTILEGSGWDADMAARFAHQKAFEFVNWTFFNNQHVGATVHRMNKVVPFFSAWAEVLGTWAYKIPSQNFLGLGYMNMIHKVDRTLDMMIKIGLVEKGEDGQFHLNMAKDGGAGTPLGQGLSKDLHAWAETPLRLIEHVTNMGRWVISGIDDDFEGAADLSAWYQDSYRIAVGSPIHINSHGVMGVNQFQFGLNPWLNYGVTTQIMQKLPYVGDTQQVGGATLSEVVENMPPDKGLAEILELNETILVDAWGQDKYDALFQGGSLTPDIALYDTEGLDIQVPRSSMFDTLVDDTFFPFGRVDTTAGVLRELVPSSLSFVLRSGFGFFLNESEFAEGIMTLITGPLEQYQIDSTINREILSLEAEEGLITKSAELSSQIQRKLEIAGVDSIEEYVRQAEPGSPESQEVSRLFEKLERLDDQIMKRATDRAFTIILGRGIMGLFGPASPRGAREEFEILSQWYAGQEMAEAARDIRGGQNKWLIAVDNAPVNSYEDIERIQGVMANWYQDPTGSQAKGWFMSKYPSLMSFIQPVTFYGPAGQPPAQRDLDNFFDDLESGIRQVLPPDVVHQRVARTAVQASREGTIMAMTGTNDPLLQAAWFLNNPLEGRELKEQYRMKIKALDMWDDELNGGAYIQWRERNEAEHGTFIDQIEEELFIMEDLMDDFIALSNISDLNEEDQQQFRVSAGLILREYRQAYEGLRDRLTEEGDFITKRDGIIGNYFVQVAEPYYKARQKVFDQMDDLETREEKSIAWEKLRDLDNIHWESNFRIAYEGERVVVPNMMERQWMLKTPEEQQADVLRWIGRKSEWLSLFNTAKIVEAFPAVDGYLPTTPNDMLIYKEATELRNAAIAEARKDPELISQHERDEHLTSIKEWMFYQLREQGRDSEVAWNTAWPIERLAMAGQLPPAMEEIAAWYKGIKANLESLEDPKGPDSEYARVQFLALGKWLEETYYLTNPRAKDAVDELGRTMFGTEDRWETYARLYGTFFGELD